MNICVLEPMHELAALAFLRRAPYRNALLLSNVSQLRERCDVLVAEHAGEVMGIASTYRDLPMPNMLFAAPNALVAQQLTQALVARNHQLGAVPLMGLLPEASWLQLPQFAQVLGHEVEFQMVVEPETLRVPTAPHARRLGHQHAAAMSQLAGVAGLHVWHEGALALGPAFGCFVGDQLVAMAATHFATSEVIEIGHVATHPDFRRQGYAAACTAALAQAALKLAPRVFLMVLEDNVAALAAYRKLGFQIMDRFYLTQFRIATD